MAEKTALVTGATGFVGGHVALHLVQSGWRVRALRRPGSVNPYLTGADLQWVEGDLRDPLSLERALSGCTALFHVAADYRLWAKDPREIYENNVTGTENILEAARRCGTGRVVHTSSVGALGLLPGGAPATEGAPVSLSDMVGHYKRSKYLAERAAERFAAEGLPVVIVNPSTPVGPGDHKPTPTGKIILDFLRGRMPAYVDTGLNLIHVRDVAAGHLLAFERGVSGQKYILGCANMTLAEILRALARISGRPAPRVRLPYGFVYLVALASEAVSRVTGRPPAAPLEGVRMSKKRMFFDSSRAVRELGLPQTPVEAALLEAVEWYRKNGYAP